jgi:hypothetical protein
MERAIPAGLSREEPDTEIAPSSRTSIESETTVELHFSMLVETFNHLQNLMRPVRACLLSLILLVKRKNLQHYSRNALLH